VQHSNVVTIHDFGIDGDTPYLVMEYMPGLTLAQAIRDGPLPVARVVAVMGDVLAGLEAAHDRGVLHRDLKPGNVLFADADRAVLCDFGVATSPDRGDLTETGVVVGTPAYLAPERLAGEPATELSDLYAVGVMTYEALAGTAPFHGENAVSLAYAVHHSAVTPLRTLRPEVPPALASVVSIAMARQAADRFTSARALHTALRDALTHATCDDVTVIPPIGTSVTQVMPVIPAETRAPTRVPRPTSRRSVRSSVIIAIVLVAAALALAVVALRNDDPGGAPATPESTVESTLPGGLQQPFDQLEQSVDG
jgi:serine/threonine-protein kinase